MSSTSIDFLYLSEPDMIAAGVTDMSACVDAMDETFALLYQGDYRMSGSNKDSHGALIDFPDDPTIPGMPHNADDRRFMAMPAYLGGKFGTTGVKWYGSNLDNRAAGLPRSIHMFVLNDTDTGAPLAIMSANLLSAYRTGAVPGVGARYLARPDSTVVGIVGPGVMAKTSLAAFIAVCPEINTVKVKGRSPEGLAQFRSWVQTTYPQITTIIDVDTIEDAVVGCDIVTFCTTGNAGDGEYPTVRREWVKPGAYLSMPAICDVDEEMLAPDVGKFVDKRGMYDAWAQESGFPSHKHIPLIGAKFIDAIHDGVLTDADVVDLGAVVTGDAPGRTSDEQITILSVGGMPVEDVAWATTLYRKAIDMNIGTRLNLWESPELA